MILPAKLDPADVFDDESVFVLLGIAPDTLAAARANGQLRFANKGGRVLYLGSWLLAWLAGDSTSSAGGGR